jgi:RHS repeat-associated protein
VVARQLYHPYGTTRYTEGTLPTDFGFTGQRKDSSTGLVFMRARYYHPALGRWASADTIVPDPANPQSFNRYSYVENNPVKYRDPSGHSKCIDAECNECVDDECNWIVDQDGLIRWYGPGAPVLSVYDYYCSEIYGCFDRQHLNTGRPGDVIADVRQAIADGGGEVIVRQGVAGALFGKHKPTFIGTYWVSSDEPYDAVEIALGIYMDWSHRFERWEGTIEFFGKGTTFAIEDLPSHRLGFFIKDKGLHPAEAFALLGGVEGTNKKPTRDIKNHTFNPWVDGESVPWPSPMTVTPIESGSDTWEFVGAECEGFGCGITDP